MSRWGVLVVMGCRRRCCEFGCLQTLDGGATRFPPRAGRTETLTDDFTCDFPAVSHQRFYLSCSTLTTQTWVTTFHVSLSAPIVTVHHTDTPTQMPQMRNRTPLYPQAPPSKLTHAPQSSKTRRAPSPTLTIRKRRRIRFSPDEVQLCLGPYQIHPTTRTTRRRASAYRNLPLVA